MAYCPRCSREYVEVRRECEDCAVPLLSGPVPSPGEEEVEGTQDEDVKVLSVRTFSGPTARLEAGLARNLLLAEGIPSILPGKTSAELLPVLVIPLLVREKDAERAARLLSDYFDSPSPDVVP